MPETFRAGVGMLVVDERGLVLALERAGVPGAWQLPQGGLEGDESVDDAVWRELREETGLTSQDVEMLGEVPEWLGYELPPGRRSLKTGRGQVHKWFLLRALSTDVPVRFDVAVEPEFRSWRWVAMEELAEQAASFRRPIYRRLAEILERFPA